MWLLKGKDGSYIYLKPGQTLTFGRTKADVVIGDQSISKIHASVTVTPKEELLKSETTSTCTLRDLGSKYGTYVIVNREAKLIPDRVLELKDMDVIRFGVQESIYTVVHIPFVVVTSGLKEHDKKQVIALIHEIDGFVSENWTPICTHLTVANATLTEKVGSAMVSLKFIVTIEYWLEVKKAISSCSELPDPKKYVPTIKEKFMYRKQVSFLPNESRQSLFKDLIFVFFTRHQYKCFSRLIAMGGGKSLLYGMKKLSVAQLCLSDVVLIQYVNDVGSQSTQTSVLDYDAIYTALREKQRRMIPETEILLAILDCSVEEYCNPKYNFSNLLARKEATQSQDGVLVPDSMDVEMRSDSMCDVKSFARKGEPESNVLIPETLDVLIRAEPDSQINYCGIVRKATIIPETQQSLGSVSSSTPRVNQVSRSRLPELLDFPDEPESVENVKPCLEEPPVTKQEDCKPFTTTTCTKPSEPAKAQVLKATEDASYFRQKESCKKKQAEDSEDVPVKIIPETYQETQEEVGEEPAYQEPAKVSRKRRSDDATASTSASPKKFKWKTPVDSDAERKSNAVLSESEESDDKSAFNSSFRVSEDGFIRTPKVTSCTKNAELTFTLPQRDVAKKSAAEEQRVARRGTKDERKPKKQRGNAEEAEEGSNLESTRVLISGDETEKDYTSIFAREDGFIECKKKPGWEELSFCEAKPEPEEDDSNLGKAMEVVCKTTFCSSFLRIDRAYKKFQKVYNLPPKRIPLDRMVVWTGDMSLIK